MLWLRRELFYFPFLLASILISSPRTFAAQDSAQTCLLAPHIQVAAENFHHAVGSLHDVPESFLFYSDEQLARQYIEENNFISQQGAEDATVILVPGLLLATGRVTVNDGNATYFDKQWHEQNGKSQTPLPLPVEGQLQRQMRIVEKIKFDLMNNDGFLKIVNRERAKYAKKTQMPLSMGDLNRILSSLGLRLRYNSQRLASTRTDKRMIYFDLDFSKKLDESLFRMVFGHELGHILIAEKTEPYRYERLFDKILDKTVLLRQAKAKAALGPLALAPGNSLSVKDLEREIEELEDKFDRQLGSGRASEKRQRAEFSSDAIAAYVAGSNKSIYQLAKRLFQALNGDDNTPTGHPPKHTVLSFSMMKKKNKPSFPESIVDATNRELLAKFGIITHPSDDDRLNEFRKIEIRTAITASI